MNVKELTIKTVQNMPETVTFEEIYNVLYLIELNLRMSESEDDIKNGRITSIENARETTLKELRKEYANKNN